MRASLREIANLYGTDKGTRGPVASWRAHNYSDVYEAYLWSLRDLRPSVLEIGVGVKGPRGGTRVNNLIAQGRNAAGGASLFMWADFFPDSRIVGLDVNDASHLDSDRIQTFVCDQSSDEQLNNFVDNCPIRAFDLIVDDGSHIAAHQQLAFSRLFQLLRPGGLYVIEDLNSCASEVLPTREVLRSFAQSGDFAGPHAIQAEEELTHEIDFVHFHVPEATMRWRRGYLQPFRPLKRVREFVEGSDRIAVIRKVPITGLGEDPTLSHTPRPAAGMS